MTSIEIYRTGSPLVTLDIDEKTIFTKKLQGEHRITSEYIHSGASGLDLTIGDYITYPASGENYTINRLPTVTKINNSTFKYDIAFEANSYNLNKKILISSDDLADFSYNGSPADFLDLIIGNINEINPTWTAATGTNTSGVDKTLQFVNESCLSALGKVAEAYDFEYDINDKVIGLQDSISGSSGYSFKYGEASGLYKLERQQVLNQNIITRCYGFGSTRNIPYTYRDAAKRLTFVASGMAASGYLQSGSASGLYGIIEGQYTDDTIYPHRTGTLTGVVFAASGTGAWDTNADYLVDSAMDFDVNDYLLEGQTATIVFKSGDLSGIECEIWQYLDATKRFYITPFVDVDAAIRPNSVNYPASGDSYTIVNISMPQSYIDTAEAALQAATQAYLDKYSVPQVVYNIDIDPKHASGISLDLSVGDQVTIVDTDLDINSLIRISGIEFPLVNPYKIKAVIADFVPYTMQERIIKSAISNSKDTVSVDKNNRELSRLNTVDRSSLSDQIALKAPIASPTFTGTVILNPDVNNTGFNLMLFGDPSTRAAVMHTNTERGDLVLYYNGDSTAQLVAGMTAKSNVHGSFGVNTGINYDITHLSALHANGLDSPDTGSTPKGILTLGGTATSGCLTAGIDSASAFYSWIQSRDTSTTTKYPLSLNPTGGNVGIGETVPDGSLHITRSASNAQLKIERITSSPGAAWIYTNTDHLYFAKDNAGSPGSTRLKIGLNTGIIEHPSFVAGWFGNNWQIDNEGDAEFENLMIRGSARFRELIIDQLAVLSGSQLLSVGRGKILSVNTASSGVTLDDPNNKGACAFIAEDFFWIKNIDIDNGLFSDVRGQITAVSGVDLTISFAASGSNGAIEDIGEGDVIVQRGHPSSGLRQNLMYKTVSDDDAPFERTITGVDSLFAFNDLDNVKLQTGNLTSLASHDIVPASPGFGLYSDNAYLKGLIQAASGEIGGFTISEAEGLYAGSGITRVQMKPGAGFWAGATAIGDAPFSVTEAGVLKAESGTIGGFTIDATSIKDIAGLVGLSSVVTGGDDIRFFAGHATMASAPFKVTEAGYVIASKFIHLYVLSNDVIASYDPDIDNTSATYFLVKTITIGADLQGPKTLRITFDLKSITSGTVSGRIYRNSSPVGTERTVGTGGATYSEDITGWSAGDAIELYTKINDLTVARSSNFRLLGTFEPILDEVTGTVS